MNPSKKPFIALIEPGCLPYGQALILQHDLRSKLQERAGHPKGHLDGCIGYLLCLQHEPVITLGKRGTLEAVRSIHALSQKSKPVDVYKIDRGGEATYHNPGQLILYPILHLHAFNMGVVDLIRGLAKSVQDVLESFNLETVYDTQYPGLWTQNTPVRQKIASVGMRVSGGTTTHGIAVNLINELLGFSLIIPCGMPEVSITRLLDHVHIQNSETLYEQFLTRLKPHIHTLLGVELVATKYDLPVQGRWIKPLDI